MKLPVESARLAAWTTAYLAGDIAPDDLAAHAVPDGHVHRVAGLSGEHADGALSLPVAAATLRSSGARRCWLVWPAPGDPAGLPGPDETNRLALATGQAVVVDGEGGPLALVPSRLGSSGVLWSVLPAEAPARAVTSLGDAERVLKAAVREATDELDLLDVARTRPEDAARIASLRDRAPEVELPGGFPVRARAVLDTSQRLAGLLGVAGSDEGGAVNRFEADARRRVLRELERAVRHAFTASVNALAEDQARAR